MRKRIKTTAEFEQFKADNDINITGTYVVETFYHLGTEFAVIGKDGEVKVFARSHKLTREKGKNE